MTVLPRFLKLATQVHWNVGSRQDAPIDYRSRSVIFQLFVEHSYLFHGFIFFLIFIFPNLLLIIVDNLLAVDLTGRNVLLAYLYLQPLNCFLY